MKFIILIEKNAAKFISKLPKGEKERVLRAIAKLPKEGDIKRLHGKKAKGLIVCVLENTGLSTV